jgi:hypothetical protein
MSTKLTLTIEKAILERAKVYAKNTGRSLSELIENYLTILTQEKDEAKLSPKLKKIVGSITLPSNFDDDKELRSDLEEKHL